MFNYMQLCILVFGLAFLMHIMVACGNVYNGVMVVVMHEVMVCVVDMVMH